jgi:hypothetical protein
LAPSKETGGDLPLQALPPLREARNLPKPGCAIPGREVLGEVTPLGSGADDPAEGVEDVAEAVLALAGILGQEAEIEQDELPLGDVAGTMP